MIQKILKKMNTLSKYGEVQEIRRSTRIMEKYEKLPRSIDKVRRSTRITETYENYRDVRELQRSTRSTEVRLFPLEYIYIEYKKENRKKDKRQKILDKSIHRKCKLKRRKRNSLLHISQVHYRILV